MSGLGDQIKRAASDLDDIIETSPRLQKFPRSEFPKDLAALADMLADAAILHWANEGSKVCRHLAESGPQPTFIFVEDPSVARCQGCAIVRDLRMHGTDADVTCDCCGVVSREVQYYPLGIVKEYVTVQGGICELCHDRVVG